MDRRMLSDEQWQRIEVSIPRNFVFQEMGYKAPANWKEKRI
jgi:hypothetical protein